jgi:hypothetical protein
MPAFAEWDSFYGIIGSAAGTLIGLQFVVMTLVAEKPSQRMQEVGPVFSTPTIVHFCTALLMSALLRAPWHTLLPAAILWGAVGVLGTVYSTLIACRMQRQSAYRLDLEDWMFHILLPVGAYAGLAVAAWIAASVAVHAAMFGVGAAVVLLLFTGIHNAWDAVAYHVFFVRPREIAREGQPD